VRHAARRFSLSGTAPPLREREIFSNTALVRQEGVTTTPYALFFLTKTDNSL